MPDWLRQWFPREWDGVDLVLGALALTVATFVLSIVVCAVAVVRIPHDYFVGEHAPDVRRRRHPLTHWPLLIARNLLGVVLILLGIVMSFPGVPGQGVLTVLMGAMLLSIPGKRRAERWLLGRRGVLRSINRIRARYGRRPLVLDAPAGIP